MKNCPECNSEVSQHLPHCGVCGALLGQVQKARRARIQFFLTPFFIILSVIAFSNELKIESSVDAGIALGGFLAIVYFFSSFIFWLLTRIFKLPYLPESFWQAGIFAVFHMLACYLLSFSLEPLLAGDLPVHLGPVKLLGLRSEALLMTFLPTWFAGVLGVSARARFVRFPDAVKSQIARVLLKQTIVIIPILVALFSLTVFVSQPLTTQIALKAKIINELGAGKTAVDYLAKAIEDNDESAVINFTLGKLIVENQTPGFDAEKAIGFLQKADLLKPGVPLINYNLSMAYDMDRSGEEAVKYAKKAVELLPEDASLWQYLGDIQLKYKNSTGAVEAYRKSLELDPENPVLLNNLAYTLLEVDSELPLALELARQSVEKLPEMVFNMDTLAWAYYKNGKNAEALEIMNKIFAGRSEVSPEVDFHYAMILYAADALNQPLKTMDSLLAKPEVAANHTLFQQIYAARNRIEGLQKTELQQNKVKNSGSIDEENEAEVEKQQ